MCGVSGGKTFTRAGMCSIVCRMCSLISMCSLIRHSKSHAPRAAYLRWQMNCSFSMSIIIPENKNSSLGELTPLEFKDMQQVLFEESKNILV